MSSDVAARGRSGAGARSPRSCVVVGAGPAGLSAAWWLQRHGVRTVVLEAAAEVGGRTRSVRVHGSTLNLGAAFLASFYDQTLALCRALELPLVSPRVHPTRAGAQRVMATPRGYVPYAPGSLRGFVRFSLVPARQRLRLLRELVSLARGPALHIADHHSLRSVDDVDARSWAVERFGQEVCDYFVRPAIEPFFYMRAEEVSAGVARALLRHAVHWSIVTPRAGMGALCAALAAPLDVQRGCRVQSIRRESRAVEIHHERGCARADAVVLAVPAPDLLAIEGGTTTSRERAEVAGARFEPCIIALMGYSHPVALPAPSVTIGGAGPHALVGATALSRGGVPGHISAGEEVVSVLAMGWRSRALLACDDDAIVAELRRDVSNLGFTLPDPAWHLVVAREQATVIPEPGFTRRLHRLASLPRERVHLAGDWLTGSSTVEGAVRSGLAAAGAVVGNAGRAERVA
ncbi:MAG TPA: FAD-dependent oxidoreductase [Conexibacter sp.]|nr:FAD-dependent oxidoreductase [Conexibacter sp.]